MADQDPAITVQNSATLDSDVVPAPESIVPDSALEPGGSPQISLAPVDVAVIESQVASIVANHNVQANELREQLEHCVQRQQELGARRVVRVASSGCPKHSLYKHFVYFLEWTDVAGEIQRTPESVHCGSGRCSHVDLAERQVTDLLEQNFQEWSQVQARLNVLQQEREKVVTQLEDLELQIKAQNPEQSLAETGLPSLASRLVDVGPDSFPLDAPEAIAAVPYVDEREREEQKQAVLDAVRRGSFPPELLSRDEQGNTWLRGENAVPYTSVAQLLSAEHQQDTDVWIEILRKNAKEVEHVNDQVLDDPKMFLWMLREQKDLVAAALPKASSRVHNDARVMMKAMEVDWRLVKEFGGSDLRNDPEVAIEAIKRFDEEMRDTMEWIGSEPKDSADVMATATFVAPSSLVHASPRLRHDKNFARKLLADSYQLDSQLNQTPDNEVAKLEQADWRIKKRLTQETRHETSAGVLRVDTWKGLESILDRLGDEAKGDAEVMQLAVLQDGRALRHANDLLKSSRSFVIGALASAREKLSHAKALATSVWMSRNLPDELRDDEEVARRAIEASSGQSIMDCWSPRLRGDKRFVLDVMQNAVFRGKMLAHVSDELKDDEEVVMAALATDGAAIKEASPRLRADKPFLLRAFQAATEPTVMNRLAMMFQRLTGSTAREPDKAHKFEAAERLTMHVGDLPDTMADDEEVVLASLENGGSLAGASERLLANPDFATKAIERFGKKVLFDQFRARFNEHLVSYLSEKVRDDDRVMLTAVKKHGASARFLSPRLKRESQFAVRALVNSDDAKTTMQYLDSSLRDDDSTMSLLAEKDAKLAVQMASPRLKSDLRFAKKVLSRAANPDDVAPALQAALEKEKPPTPQPRPFPQRQNRTTESQQPEAIQPQDVAIVAAVIVFGLLIGLTVYLNPILGVGVLAAAMAIGVFIFMGNMAFRQSSDTDRSSSSSDRSDNRPRTRGTRTEGDVHYNRKGQIEADKRKTNREFPEN